MLKRMAYRTLSLMVCALVFASVAVAHEVTISQKTSVGTGSMLQPGSYRVEVVKNQDSAEVRFFRSGDLVASVPVTVTQEAEKCRATQVHTDEVDGRQTITKIWLAGSKESLLIRQDGSKTE